MNVNPTTVLIETSIREHQRSALALPDLMLVWFGIIPPVQGVSPAPDGGYSGGNTAERQNALFSSVLVFITRLLVSIPSRATPSAMQIRLLGPARSLLPRQTKIQLRALGRYSATAPARPMRPTERLLCLPIPTAATTRPAARSRSLTTRRVPSIRPSA
jgi:hypothetical protein